MLDDIYEKTPDDAIKYNGAIRYLAGATQHGKAPMHEHHGRQAAHETTYTVRNSMSSRYMHTSFAYLLVARSLRMV